VEHAGNPTTFVEAGQGPVHSGKRALKRTAKGVAQDYFANGASFDIPPNGVISVWVYLEPTDLPKSIMVQFHVGGWNHRAYWGEEGAIPFGRVRTPEKVNAGELPEAGKWTQLKVDAAKLGLKPGMKVDGFAFTQFDGTVYWDRLAISHRIEEAKDVQMVFPILVRKEARHARGRTAGRPAETRPRQEGGAMERRRAQAPARLVARERVPRRQGDARRPPRARSSPKNRARRPSTTRFPRRSSWPTYPSRVRRT
jgi:hypothetical protein